MAFYLEFYCFRVLLNVSEDPFVPFKPNLLENYFGKRGPCGFDYLIFWRVTKVPIQPFCEQLKSGAWENEVGIQVAQQVNPDLQQESAF